MDDLNLLPVPKKLRSTMDFIRTEVLRATERRRSLSVRASEIPVSVPNGGGGEERPPSQEYWHLAMIKYPGTEFNYIPSPVDR